MRVRVRPLRQNGRNLNRDELKDIPPHVGFLKIGESRNYELSRPMVRAQLLDAVSGVETDVLPELCDARLLWAEDKKMRLTGTERVRDADFAQTWSVEFD
jgi:hypothetical protein